MATAQNISQKRLAAQRDIVGLELGSNLPQGVPAVRLKRTTAGKLELVAADFLNFPTYLPANAKAAMETGSHWRLPRVFRTPHVALAFTSPQNFLRQTSEASAATAPADHEGFRQSACHMAQLGTSFVAGMPEHYIPWALQRFPEGHRPTVSSIQTSESALLSGFQRTPFLQEAQGNCVVIFTHNLHCQLAAFMHGQLLLLRSHPQGNEHLLAALCEALHVSRKDVTDLLNDNVVDPTPIIMPILHPLFRQAEISADYLARRLNADTIQFCAYGNVTGKQFWQQLFFEKTRRELHFPAPFDGIALTGHNLANTIMPAPHQFLTAMGAAQAAMEGG